MRNSMKALSPQLPCRNPKKISTTSRPPTQVIESCFPPSPSPRTAHILLREDLSRDTYTADTCSIAQGKVLLTNFAHWAPNQTLSIGLVQRAVRQASTSALTQFVFGNYDYIPVQADGWAIWESKGSVIYYSSICFVSGRHYDSAPSAFAANTYHRRYRRSTTSSCSLTEVESVRTGTSCIVSSPCCTQDDTIHLSSNATHTLNLRIFSNTHAVHESHKSGIRSRLLVFS